MEIDVVARRVGGDFADQLGGHRHAPAHPSLLELVEERIEWIRRHRRDQVEERHDDRAVHRGVADVDVTAVRRPDPSPLQGKADLVRFRLEGHLRVAATVWIGGRELIRAEKVRPELNAIGAGDRRGYS
jgi:hypothetical protein